MCTVTWWRGPDRYEVFFNRDEQHRRPPAIPPREQVAAGVRYLAPIDPQGGGTWLAVNDRGVTGCLLNYYEREAAATPAEPVSRGLLLMGLLHHSSALALATDAAARASDRYAPFLLLAFDEQDTCMVRWDGSRAATSRLADADRPVSTSSFDTESVIACRRAAFARVTLGQPSPETLRRYHLSVDERGGPWSVCLTRRDAQTVSISRVQVARDVVTFTYEPRESDDRWGAATVSTLARHA